MPDSVTGRWSERNGDGSGSSEASDAELEEGEAFASAAAQARLKARPQRCALIPHHELPRLSQSLRMLQISIQFIKGLSLNLWFGN